jgi:hypothetical protein
MAKYAMCQHMKVKHQKPTGELQPLPIPKWKWEDIIMDFISRLPRSRKDNNVVWVFVDRLIKSILFLPINRLNG